MVFPLSTSDSRRTFPTMTSLSIAKYNPGITPKRCLRFMSPLGTVKGRAFATTFLIVAVGLAQLASAQVFPGRPPDAPAASPYALLPFEDDWSVVDELDVPTDDPARNIKAIDVGNNASLSLRTETRARVDVLDPGTFSDGVVSADTVSRVRAMASADLRVGNGFRTFVTLQYADTVGAKRPSLPIDVDRLDLQNAFVELSTPIGRNEFALRVGRQELSFGSTRMIAVRDSPNARLAFDGMRFDMKRGDGSVSAFVLQPAEDEIGTFDDGTDTDREFWGIYGTATSWLPASTVETYYFALRETEALFVAGAGPSERHTFGARVSGATSAWDWDAEGAYQHGNFSGDGLSAWTIAAQFGHSWPDVAFSPRFGLTGSAISGDDGGTDRLETFDPPFPRGSYFDPAGLIGARNLLHLQPALGLSISPSVSATLYANAFWRESVDDGIYNGARQLVRGPGGSDERFVGTSWALGADWRPDIHWKLELELVHFEPGTFLRNTGSDDNGTFVQVELTHSF